VDGGVCTGIERRSPEASAGATDDAGPEPVATRGGPTCRVLRSRHWQSLGQFVPPALEKGGLTVKMAAA